MNELQDAICDRLVGAKLERGWENGLLHVVGAVIHPGFRLAPNDNRKRHDQATNTLNWPRMLVIALYGASSVLDDEEDRRALGIALFREFAPRDKRKRESTRLNRETLIWAAMRAHPLACPGECLLHEEVSRVTAQFLKDGKRLGWEDIRSAERALSACPGFQGSAYKAIHASSPPGHHAVVAYRYLIEALNRDQPAFQCGDGARESARVEAKVNGVKGALSICREMGKRLGL